MNSNSIKWIATATVIITGMLLTKSTLFLWVYIFLFIISYDN